MLCLPAAQQTVLYAVLPLLSANIEVILIEQAVLYAVLPQLSTVCAHEV